MKFQPSQMEQGNAPADILAKHFCAILNSWLTPDQIREAVTLNTAALAEGDHSVCHSHDHCDANQAMLDAWEIVFGMDAVPAAIRKGATNEEINRDDAIWNAAWLIAKQCGFAVKEAR